MKSAVSGQMSEGVSLEPGERTLALRPTATNFGLKDEPMKHKKLTVFIVIAVIVIMCSLVFFYYSIFVSHMASYNVHRELQRIYASNQTTRTLTLTKEKFEELLHWAEQDEKGWRFQLGSSFYSRECHGKVTCSVEFDSGIVVRSDFKRS